MFSWYTAFDFMKNELLVYHTIEQPDSQEESIDIGAQSEWPSEALSNFAPHEFVLDGVQCASMEGFLQSLKFADPEKQKEVCLLIGKKAKFAGKKKKWWVDQTLHWQSAPIDRHSDEYQQLLNRAYSQLAITPDFQKALLSTGNMNLTHTIGKDDPYTTVLTEQEFITRLELIREVLQEEQISSQES